MDRPITRRAFLDGVRIAATGSLLGTGWLTGCRSEVPVPGIEADYYPPALTGLRGSHDGSFERAHDLRDGRSRIRGTTTDTGEDYDLVVVGGGISGLAAAYFFRQAEGPGSKILILDNHEDFGGHATRNEFTSGGRTLLMNGGTLNIQDFNWYDEVSQGLIRELGIDMERYSEFEDDELYPSLGLSRGVFFDKETFGVDRLVTGRRELGWREFLARAPLSERARNDIARLYEEQVDYLSDLSWEDKEAALRRMSYLEYLTNVVGVHQDAIPYLQALPVGTWAIGIDAFPAWAAWDSDYPGFQGMDSGEKASEGAYFRFPDGNASITRLLVRSMIPGAAPGNDMDDIVTAPFDYAQLDREEAPVRIRLNSTAIRAQNVPDERNPEAVEITYLRGGKAQRVRGRSCVLACYNMMIPYLCPELPEQQREALSYALKAPLVYSRVLIRDWKSFERLGLQGAYCPGSYHSSVRLGDPVSMGGYHCPRTPDEPMVLQLTRVPLQPGLPAPEQWKIGRKEPATFEMFERKIRDQLGRMLSAGGFDPARDIEAITVNRWSHGYAYGYDPATSEVDFLTDWPEERQTWLRARRPFGRIAIANSDAAANAMTEAAISQAHRAVSEILG
ncbi:MAG: NAD(P)-binding protein [bacterium]|nr:NAD(P)-binding protein [bacterium]